jgi:hypothetical protein
MDAADLGRDRRHQVHEPAPDRGAQEQPGDAQRHADRQLRADAVGVRRAGHHRHRAGVVTGVDEPLELVDEVQFAAAVDPEGRVVHGDALHRQAQRRPQRHEPAAAVPEDAPRAGVLQDRAEVGEVGLDGLGAGQRRRVRAAAPVVQVHREPARQCLGQPLVVAHGGPTAMQDHDARPGARRVHRNACVVRGCDLLDPHQTLPI